MTDAELNKIGQGVLLALQKTCTTPGDALSVLVYCLLCLWDFKPADSRQDMTFSDFAGGFKAHAIATYNSNQVKTNDEGETLQ